MAGARFRTTSRLPKIAPCDFVEPAMLISSAFRSFLSCLCAKSGAPGRTRTCDPRLRRPMLYPAELRAQSASHIVLPFGSPHVHPCTANQPDHPRSVVRAARRHVKCPRENIRTHPRLRRPMLYPAELRAQCRIPNRSQVSPATKWSGREDSNLRPSAPKADALPDCATPRQKSPLAGVANHTCEVPERQFANTYFFGILIAPSRMADQARRQAVAPPGLSSSTIPAWVS